MIATGIGWRTVHYGNGTSFHFAQPGVSARIERAIDSICGRWDVCVVRPVVGGWASRRADAASGADALATVEAMVADILSGRVAS